MSLARYLSKLAAFLGSDGKVPPAGLSTGAPTWDASGNVTLGGNLVAGSNSANKLSVNGNSTGQPAYLTATGTDTNVGIDVNTKGTGAVRLNTNGQTVVQADGAGLVTLPFGQLKFPATQNPSSDANTLDDYEEGFFTFTDQSGAGLSLTTNGAGYRNQYIKIGSLIFVSGSVTFPTTANTNQAAISLPFVPYANGFYSGGGFVTFSERTPTKCYQITIENGAAKFYIMDGTSNTTNADWSGKRVDFQLIYRANS